MDQKILDIFSSAPVHIFIFYLIVSGNFVGETFSCRLQKHLSQNIYLKHFVGFMLLFFFAIFVDDSKKINIYKQIIYTSIVYIIFILTTKTTVNIFIIVAILLFIIYILNEIEKYEKDVNENIDFSENVKYIKFGLSITALTILLIGNISYLLDKKKEYKSKFSLISFFFGRPICRGLTTVK